ncbi:MAG: hypothetical protein J6Q59_04480 [Paludibacteraceae bacterium]|nr:hypothetical protein [Paludibacteraceae bacterium]
MNVDLLEYEMKKAGYRTPEQRAEVLGLSISSYYRRLNGTCEWSKKEMDIVSDLFGWEVMRAIFFD